MEPPPRGHCRDKQVLSWWIVTRMFRMFRRRRKKKGRKIERVLSPKDLRQDKDKKSALASA